MFGFVYRPIDALRITSDFEFGYNDNSYTRIDPRQVQSYKIHASYKVKTWATVDGAFEIHENRDNVTDINNLEHDRTFSFATILMLNQRFSIDFGYNYWNCLYPIADLLRVFHICYQSRAAARYAPCFVFSHRRSDAAHWPGMSHRGRLLSAGRAFDLLE